MNVAMLLGFHGRQALLPLLAQRPPRPEDLFGEGGQAVLLLAGFLVSTEIFSEVRVPFTSIVLRGARHEGREAVEH